MTLCNTHAATHTLHHALQHRGAVYTPQKNPYLSQSNRSGCLCLRHTLFCGLKCVPLFQALYICKRALHTRKRAPCSNVMGNFKEHGAYELCLSDMWVSFADKKSPVYPQKSPMFKCNGYSQRTWCVRVMSLKYVGLFCG